MHSRRDYRSALQAAVLVTAFFSVPLISLHASDASLYFSPTTGQVNVGQTFSVAVRVNTGGTAINAVEGSLVFDPEKLDVISVSKGSSVLSIWAEEPKVSNAEGTIDFGGGLPNPGYSGANGLVLAVTFKAVVRGDANINLVSGAILANDGQGTNILSSLGRATYAINGGTPATSPQVVPASVTSDGSPEVASSTHPDPAKWYANNSPQFSWNVPSDVTGVSFIITEKELSNPGPNSDGLKNSTGFSNIGDGTHYFHIKFKRNGTWSPISHFKFNIDTTPPHDVNLVLATGSTPKETQVQFNAVDDQSGIDHYEIKAGETADWVTVGADKAATPYAPSFSHGGQVTIYVKAVDRAGNATTASLPVTVTVSNGPMGWVLHAIDLAIGFVSANALLTGFLALLVGFIVLLMRVIHAGLKGVLRRFEGRPKKKTVKGAKGVEQKPDKTVERLLKDMSDEIKFLKSISRRRHLGPEEKYLKSKIEQYIKTLKQHS